MHKTTLANQSIELTETRARLCPRDKWNSETMGLKLISNVRYTKWNTTEQPINTHVFHARNASNKSNRQLCAIILCLVNKSRGNCQKKKNSILGENTIVLIVVLKCILWELISKLPNGQIKRHGKKQRDSLNQEMFIIVDRRTNKKTANQSIELTEKRTRFCPRDKWICETMGSKLISNVRSKKWRR